MLLAGGGRSKRNEKRNNNTLYAKKLVMAISQSGCPLDCFSAMPASRKNYRRF
jgi:glucosamine 6-phosphate synthetase-like amidotransferase/phosphosugar isomerase protein